jgi:hypothetical protein
MRAAVIAVCSVALAACVFGGAGASGTLSPSYAIHVYPRSAVSQPRHSHRFEVAQKLARGISALCRQGSGGCALRGQAFTIEDVGWREHTSPAFMVGASFTESSGGDAACSGNPKNIYGLSSCGSGWYVPYFKTWRESFTFFARFIHRRWPGARTAYQLPGYSACDACWGPRTALWMSRLGFGPGLAYP